MNTDSVYQIGGETVLMVAGYDNVYVGPEAGKNNSGFYNTFIGAHAGSTNTTGSYNTFLGVDAGCANTTGNDNTFLGLLAGYSNTTGKNNVFLGQAAGYQNSTGDDNVFLGEDAGVYHTEGDKNVFIGNNTGYFNNSGSQNVFLGNSAGYYETGSNKFYVANDIDTSDVLIYGEFDNGRVGLGTLTPQAHLHVESSHQYAGLFESDSSSTETHVVHAEYTGSTTDAIAVYGNSTPGDYYGYGGYFEGGYKGLYGTVTPTGLNTYTGVQGEVSGGAGFNYGVFGNASGSGTNFGVYGSAFGSGTNYAGYFNGDVDVTGTLSKGGGSFKIDHPLDPANKYLSHSFVESPDMMNVYNGNIVLDAAGQAWVELPEWFQTVNRDFRYQLTAIGAPGPNLYIAEEISANRFRIAGGESGMKVSWMVTGIRQDAWAEKNRIRVEELKSGQDRGRYLHPDLYGQPESMGIHSVDREKMERRNVVD